MGSQGEEGWPLGLPPVTFRMRLVDAFTAAAGGGGGGEGGGDANSLVSTATSSSSSSTSSDLDTQQSTMSFFPEKRISLGSLIGIAGAAADPSFRHSLSSAVVTSKTLPGRHNWLTRRSDSGAKLWNLIRCGSCRGACYADDVNSCMIGEPPSLGHFLEAEREAERSGNDAKVYINIMYEAAAGAYVPQAINPLFDSDTSPGVHINASSSAAVELPSLAEEDTETPISSPFGRSRNTSVAAHSMQSMHIDGVFRAAVAAASPVASPMQQKKHWRSYSDGVCVLNCVSCMRDFPKGSDIKEIGSQDTYTCSRIKERKCGHKKGICHTNYSPDGTHSMRFDGEARICSSNSGLNVTDFAPIVLKAEICSRKGINFGQLSGCYGQKEAK